MEFINVLKEWPSLLANVIIIMLFLKYMSAKSESAHRNMKILLDRYRECHEQTTNCVDKNTEVLGEVKGLLLKLNGSSR